MTAISNRPIGNRTVRLVAAPVRPKSCMARTGPVPPASRRSAP
jgi:hypothetical protein